MRFPVKLNRGFWPAALCRVLPAAHDPLDLVRPDVAASARTRAISALKFGTTFKTTRAARYPAMVAALGRIDFERPPVVLDIGASDGSASLATLHALAFSRYHLTDLNPIVRHRAMRSTHYFYDTDDRCILAANRLLVNYRDDARAAWPLGALSRAALRRAPAPDTADVTSIELIDPAVRAFGSRVQVHRHDIFMPWKGERPDLVVAANLLNHVYFDHEQIRRALSLMIDALDGHGYIALVDNRPEEHGSLFEVVSGKPVPRHTIGSGAESASLMPGGLSA